LPVTSRLLGFALTSLLAAFVYVTPANAAARGPSVTLNFPDTEIGALSKVMADILGRPILLDSKVKGKLTLVSDQGVSKAQAYALFVSSLRGLGYAVVESNGLLKVLPEADAKVQAGTVSLEPATVASRQGDPVLTQIFRPNFESANNLLAVLRPMISANNLINVNPGNNSLVITDYASNLARIGQVISALDTPSATDVEVIPLEHALATDLAATVTRLTDPSGSSGASAGVAASAGTGGNAAATRGAAGGVSSAGGATILADPHSNALLVRAANPARLAAIRALVARLDRPGATGLAGSNVHVIYLKHAEATRLATVLRAAFSAEALGGTGSGASAGSGLAAQMTSARPAVTSSGISTGDSSSTGNAGASAQATAPVSGSAQPSTGGYIQADPASNALIVTAPEPLFRELAAVVEQLDDRRAQLYVESLVVEVDAGKALDAGLQWKQIFNISSSTDLTLGTVAQAIQSTSGTNILSTANLVTLDNEEARIVVGQNVPFVTGSYTSSTTTNPFQTIERKDVGLTLRIRPQIGPGGAIRMSILQESSSVSSSTTPGTTNAGPTTNKRAIESTVVVNDGKIIVLGGLIEDSYVSDADQWPVLGDIPWLGALFRTLSRSRKKTNLLVFLRPMVMPDEESTTALSLDRYEMIRARQRALPPDVHKVLPDDTEMPLAPASPGGSAGT
jgi:general secretion pathway protein D